MHPVAMFYDADETDLTYFPPVLDPRYTVKLIKGSLTPDTVEDATVLSVRAASAVTAEIMAHMPSLRHIACRTTGYDHVDLAYAKGHGITVSNIPRYGEATVAEYAFLLLLAVSRKLLPTVHATQFGPIIQSELVGHDLSGKTLGVIGTGRIGQHAASIGRGFGMTVIGYDIYPQEEAAKTIGFTYAPLDELLAKSDYLTLHAPATPQTKHLLDAAAFAKMKPGVILVNTARGSLIDTPALVEAIENGQVAAAGLDVLEGEEYVDIKAELQLLGTEHLGEHGRQVLGLDILSKKPNVIITAHNGYNSAEALERIRETTAGNIQAWESDKPQNLIKS